MESGQSLFTCIGRRRDEKVRGLGLQLCFGLFVSYKMGLFLNPARDAWASLLKDSETLLEASVTIVMGVGTYVILIYCLRWKCSLKKKV
jgi:hypothetical protein